MGTRWDTGTGGGELIQNLVVVVLICEVQNSRTCKHSASVLTELLLNGLFEPCLVSQKHWCLQCSQSLKTKSAARQSTGHQQYSWTRSYNLIPLTMYYLVRSLLGHCRMCLFKYRLGPAVLWWAPVAVASPLYSDCSSGLPLTTCCAATTVWCSVSLHAQHVQQLLQPSSEHELIKAFNTSVETII